MAGSIIEECDRLLGMINATLEVSSVEAGIVPLLIEKVDIAEVARDACELLQPAAEDKGDGNYPRGLRTGARGRGCPQGLHGFLQTCSTMR